MKKITLFRPNESFNKNFTYEIVVGNTRLTELKNGEEKIIEIPSELESEQIQAKLQWCGSEKIELKNLNENEKVIVNGNEFLNRKMPFLFIIFPITGIVSFTNSEIIPKNISLGILILMIVALVGTLTIGRNKWLKLKSE